MWAVTTGLMAAAAVLFLAVWPSTATCLLGPGRWEMVSRGPTDLNSSAGLECGALRLGPPAGLCQGDLPLTCSCQSEERFPEAGPGPGSQCRAVRTLMVPGRRASLPVQQAAIRAWRRRNASS